MAVPAKPDVLVGKMRVVLSAFYFNRKESNPVLTSILTNCLNKIGHPLNYVIINN